MCYTCGQHQQNYGPLREIVGAEPIRHGGIVQAWAERLACGHTSLAHSHTLRTTVDWDKPAVEWERETVEESFARLRELKVIPKRRRCWWCYRETVKEQEAAEAARQRAIDRERRRNLSPRPPLRVVR